MAISDLVTTTIVGFIDYAIVLVTLMCVWYFVKFFIVAPPTKEEKEAKRKAYESRGEEWRKGISEGINKKKKKDEEKKKVGEKESHRQRKENLVSPVKKNIINATEAADDAVSAILGARTGDDRKAILEHFKTFNGEMEEAWGNLKTLRRKVDDKKEREFLKDRMEHAESIKEHVVQKLKGKLPGMSPDWVNQTKPVIAEIKKVRAMCHDFWKKIEKFHE